MTDEVSEALGRRSQGDIQGPAELLRASADSGRVEALYELGRTLFKAKRFDDAIHRFAEAANQGHVGARFALGAIEYLGGSVDPPWDTVWWNGRENEPGAIVGLGIVAFDDSHPALAASYWRRAADLVLDWTNAAHPESSESVSRIYLPHFPPPRPPRRIFISRALELTRYPEGHSYAAAAVEVVARVGDTPVEMNYFAADSDEPESLCARLLKTCDIYVGIVGYTYGTPVRSDSRRSYTEMEMDLAGRNHMRRLVFVLDDDLLEQRALEEPFSDRQRELRERLKAQQITLSYVHHVDEFAVALEQTLLALDGPLEALAQNELFIAHEMTAVPAHPSMMVGYAPDGALETESVVLGPEQRFVRPATFRSQMSHGDEARWTLRWNVDSTEVLVAVRHGSGLPTPAGRVGDEDPAGTCGYMCGMINQAPEFALAEARGRSNVVEVRVEWQYWAPVAR
jgi:Domain of unknown function (DUF4062)